MRIIHDKLRENHHLKHYNRRYYTLYLKGIGMTSDQTVELFREEFTGKGCLSLQEFREYEYYVRHAYGEKGSCINYEPKNCEYLMKRSSAIDDCNGCPFVNIENNRDIEDFGKIMTTNWNVVEKCKT